MTRAYWVVTIGWCLWSAGALSAEPQQLTRTGEPALHGDVTIAPVLPTSPALDMTVTLPNARIGDAVNRPAIPATPDECGMIAYQRLDMGRGLDNALPRKCRRDGKADFGSGNIGVQTPDQVFRRDK